MPRSRDGCYGPRLAPRSSTGQVALSWAALEGTGSAPTGYNVYEGTRPGQMPATPVNGATPLTGTALTVPGLAAGTTYYFEVTALDSAGEGATSNEASAVTVGPPGAPVSLAVTAGRGQASLTWAAPTSNGGSPITGYNVYVATAPGAPGTKVATVTSTSHVVTGLSNGTYYFRTTAVNAMGEGPASAQVSTTLGHSTSPPSLSLPGAPSALMAGAASEQVSLSWAPPSFTGGSPVRGYNVYMSTAPAVQGTKIATVASTGYTATGLLNGTTYFFEVTAVNSTGEGPVSAQVSATPQALTGYPVLTAKGQVISFGQLSSYPVRPLGSAAVGMASALDGYGYWLALKAGGVRAAGEVRLYGSMAKDHLNSPIVGIAATSDGQGYWLVAADGGIFAFGDAQFYGSLAKEHLKAPIVGIATTQDGRGYWLAAADGGVFAFGDGHFYGTATSAKRAGRVVGLAA